VKSWFCPKGQQVESPPMLRFNESYKGFKKTSNNIRPSFAFVWLLL